ncbi:hypothetical protein [Microbacterium sp.]|uniref:hypothetical protein n=1 Tax=Microbacterium sp. TaxID=51671 RepID=UPI0039E2FBF7
MRKTLVTIIAVAALTLLGSTGAYAADGDTLLDAASETMTPDTVVFLSAWIAGGLLAFAGGGLAVARSVRRARRVAC